MPDKKTNEPPTLTQILRERIQDAESLRGIESACGVQRGSLRRFARGEQSLRLDIADKLIKHFEIEIKAKD